MNKSMLKTVLSTLFIGGCAIASYIIGRNTVLSKITKVRSIDIDFIKKWIADRDFEEYNKSYTVVMLRGEDLPKYKMLKFLCNTDSIVALCVYDKMHNRVVYQQMFDAENISKDFGIDSFVEFPFEI